MRLTRKLYSEPEDNEDEKDEKTWKRRRNIGIVGTGAGLVLNRIGAGVESGKSSFSRNILEQAKKAIQGKEYHPTYSSASPHAKKLKGGGLVLGIAGTGLAVGSEIKRRKLKKKDDENKA